MEGVLRSHPVLTIGVVLVVITITIALRTGSLLIGLTPYLVFGATALVVLGLTQAWIMDALGLRRRPPLKEESVDS